LSKQEVMGRIIGLESEMNSPTSYYSSNCARDTTWLA